MRPSKIVCILVALFTLYTGQLVMAQGVKKPAPKPVAKGTPKGAVKGKPKPAPPATGVVVSLNDVFLGSTSTEFAANGKVLRGSLKVGEKLQIMTIEDRVVGCTVKKLIMNNTHLESKQAGKDYEAFIVFDAENPNLEYSFGCIIEPNSVKNYLEFQQLAQAYTPTPAKKGTKPVDTRNIFSLEAEKDPNAPPPPKDSVNAAPPVVKVISAPKPEEEPEEGSGDE